MLNVESIPIGQSSAHCPPVKSFY